MLCSVSAEIPARESCLIATAPPVLVSTPLNTYAMCSRFVWQTLSASILFIARVRDNAGNKEGGKKERDQHMSMGHQT